MPVIILGGIYGGIFTPTEAAAVSVVYGLFVGMVIYREVSFRDLFDILVDSIKTVESCWSLQVHLCFHLYVPSLVLQRLHPDCLSIAHNQFVFLLIVNIIFLIAGCFIDANSAMYIFIPIILPVCKHWDATLLHFGVMATVNLAIGQVTPPVGVNLLLRSVSRSKKGLEVTLQQISKAVMPMIASAL